MTVSRTEKVLKNAGVAAGAQISNILISFVNRSMFIYYLGVSYLSINGLFSNILTVLSLAELGLSSAITYSLYRPLLESNYEKINAILSLYKKAYRYIALIIGLLGISVIPLLGFIVKDVPDVKEDITIIYVLILSNTVVSYLLSYRKVIITADQKDYIVTIYQQVVYIFQSAFQIAILVLTSNYLFFLIVQFIFTILNNYIINRIASKMYPFTRGGSENKLSKEERKSLFSNVKAIFYYKFGSVLLAGTNGIIIAAILKVQLVGLVSNYTLIIGSINVVVSRAFEGIAATIGNFNLLSDRKNNKNIFDQLFFISFWCFSFCSISLTLLLGPFINLWVGEKYVCSQITSMALVSTFYVLGLNIVPSLYRTSLGLFNQVKYTPVFAAIINLILCVVLGKAIGLPGILFATTISRIVTYSVVDPVTVYREHFKVSPLEFYIKYFMYMLIMILGYLITEAIILLIKPEGFSGFIFKVLICLITINTYYYVLFSKTQIFRALLLRFSTYWKKGQFQV